MQLNTAVWTLILLALIGANLPFLNQRLFALISLGESIKRKPFWIRLLEMLSCYFFLGWLSDRFESSISNVFNQKWEFFVISFCLFVVLAFPGFVFQYLRRQ